MNFGMENYLWPLHRSFSTKKPRSVCTNGSMNGWTNGTWARLWARPSTWSCRRTASCNRMFIAKARLSIIQRAIMGPADLVAEVISLGGRARDRIEKRDLYEQYGVQEYWIIDPEPETVDVLCLVNSRYELCMRCGAGDTAASRLLPGFEIKATWLFRGK